MSTWNITLHDKIVKRFSLAEGQTITIGRGSNADITLDNTAISRLHTRISQRDGLFLLADLNSLNGTYVNGRKISSETVVGIDDTVRFGKFRLVAGGTDSGAAAVSSHATPMDIDEETMFIPGLKGPTAAETSGTHQVRHKLLAVAGPQKGVVLPLDGRGSVKIGKDASCDMVINGWLVARAQCYILQKDEKFFLVPQRSWTGTWLNGTKVKSEQQLRKGDLLSIRSTTLRFE